MQTTLDLLDRAMKKTGASSRRALAKSLNLSPTTLNNAAMRGSLSPVIAGQLAELTGEPIQEWMALAVLESEPRSRVTDHLKRLIATAQRSSKV